MRMRTIAMTLLICAAFPAASGAADTDDAAFVANAASGGMMEVELGSLAEKKAADPDVKAFGRRMVEDHSKANDGLRAVAAKAGIPVPGKMSAENHATVQELSALQGEAFNRRYVELMVEDHEKDVAAFHKQASAGDSSIDSWARDTLPTLERHLEMARELARNEHGDAARED